MQTINIDYGRGTLNTTMWQLLQWKHALRLEAKGLTLSRGKKVSTHLKKLMGLKRSTSVSYLSEWIEGIINQIKEEQTNATVSSD